ncbi:MAG TPA: AMP-binding protein [Stellaceae bacterium]|nr:AMP-binding protein [Stellaceae bacterium]
MAEPASAHLLAAETCHIDTWARDRLPPVEQWPVMLFDLPDVRYPERLNAAVELLDRMVDAGRADKPCLLTLTETWTYRQLQQKVNQIAHVLLDDLGVVPGNRVMIRSANTPMLVAIYLATVRIGAITIPTMPLLRAKELLQTLNQAEISLALCDIRLMPALEEAAKKAPSLQRIVSFNGAPGDGLEGMMEGKPVECAAADTRSTDICLIAFTSGTTGVPKMTTHFHRDILAICDTFSKHILQPQPDDLFCGSPPLAFTFGFGGLVSFPMRVGAATLLLEQAAPEQLSKAIAEKHATICFTAPTAYRLMVQLADQYDLTSLRKCVSAGEALPAPTWHAFKQRTGIEIIDGIGGTEMLHIFISAAPGSIRPGATGKPIPGFAAQVIDEDGNRVPPGTLGRLAVRGPTGCRYLADARQTVFVQHGWNITGDAYIEDTDGYFWYQSRTDDMIISAGYNIAGPEVESALLAHPTVAECAVVGVPSAERGQIAKAFIVLRDPSLASDALAKTLQDYVKQEIAPYKYPRAVEFVAVLPRTETGKLQRFVLRQQETAKQTVTSS